MIHRLVHPRRERLVAFASGELETSARSRLARHLVVCPDCREQVMSVRGLATAARALPIPPVPDGTWARIAARRAAGDRVVLPPYLDGEVASSPSVAGERASTRRRTRAAWAALMLVAIGIGTLVGTSSHRLEAGDIDGELRFLTAAPKAGDSVHVEYRSGPLLGSADRLRLRSRFRTAGDEPPDFTGQARYRVAAHLTRGRDGLFRGVFHFPDSVVFAEFAVEDASGQRVDNHSGRLWDLVARDTSGRPRLDALLQRAHAFYERDREVSLRTAQEATQLYPDSPEAVNLAFWYEMELAGTSAADSVRSRYRPRFDSLHVTLGQQASLAQPVIETMARLASGLAADSAAAYWKARAIRQNPASFLAVWDRISAAQRAAKVPRELLRALDLLWDEEPRGREPLLLQGFMTARQIGGAEALHRWGLRMDELRPDARAFVTISYVESPGLREEAMRRLREEIRAELVMDDGRRQLLHDQDEARRQRDGVLHLRLKALGEALAASERYAASRDTLEKAAALRWSTAVYRTLATVQLALGDSAAAVRASAYAAVDATNPAAFGDSVRRRFPGYATHARWTAWTKEARAELRDRVLAQGTSRTVRGYVRLADGTGREHMLSDLLGDRPTIVAFWSRYCAPSIEELPKLQAAVQQLQRTGVRVVAITREPPSPELEAWLKAKSVRLPIYHDMHGDATRAFEPFGTPDTFVLDGRGVIRFEHGGVEDLSARVGALLP
jgi:peroxiredoxin